MPRTFSSSGHRNIRVIGGALGSSRCTRVSLSEHPVVGRERTAACVMHSLTRDPKTPSRLTTGCSDPHRYTRHRMVLRRPLFCRGA